MHIFASLSLVLISLPLLAGCGGSDATPPVDDSASQACVDAINQHRASINAPAYTRWKEQEACANGQAEQDADSGAAHGAFGTCMEGAQNECPGWPGPPTNMIGGCLQMMWSEGPGTDFATHGHYINMSSTSYTKVACGFVTLPNGSVWAVQNFK